MLRLLLIPSALVALLAGALLWSGGGSMRRADFAFISPAEVTSLDPNRISWVQDFRLAYSLWEGLYTIDPVTLDAINGSAEKVDITDNGRVYTFHIRPDAKWSNGDDLLAKDYIFGWRRMLEEPGEYTYLLYYIKGAKEYCEAFEKDTQAFDKQGDHAPISFSAVFSTVGIKELGPKTLQVTLVHPCAPFPDICTMPVCFPVNERSMEKFLDQNTFEASQKRIRRYDKKFTLPPYLVTNGPYMLTSWEFRRRMRLTANPNYWDRAHVKCRIIDQLSTSDPQWAYAMYETGGADWIPDFVGEIAAEVRARHSPDLHQFPGFGTYFYSFNCRPQLNDGRKNPFADVRVRQAFTMAIDKQVIVEKITRLGEIPSSNYIPPGSFSHYVSPKGLPMDIAAARKLMADAGYPDGKGFPPVSILFNNEMQHGPIAENIRRQWLDNLGVDMKLEGIEIKLFREKLHNKDYSVARASWFGDYNDPSTFTDKYKPDSENNDSAWINAEYAKKCNQADIETDRAKRLKYFAEAEQILLDEAPILPLYTYVGSYLYKPYVKGIPLHPRQMLVLKSVEVAH